MLKSLKADYMHMNLLLVTFALVAGMLPSIAGAASSCRQTLSGRTRSPGISQEFKVSALKNSDKIQIKPATMKKVKKIFDRNGIILSTENLVEAIEATVEVIQGGTRKPS